MRRKYFDTIKFQQQFLTCTKSQFPGCGHIGYLGKLWFYHLESNCKQLSSPTPIFLLPLQKYKVWLAPSLTIWTEWEFRRDMGFEPTTPECWVRAFFPQYHSDFSTFIYTLYCKFEEWQQDFPLLDLNTSLAIFRYNSTLNGNRLRQWASLIRLGLICVEQVKARKGI